MTSNASNKPLPKTKRKTERELSRPFDPSIRKRAKTIAAQYSVVLQPHERLGYLGCSIEMPTVFTHGKTTAKCLESTRKALETAVAVMLELGETPPMTSFEGIRDQQINV